MAPFLGLELVPLPIASSAWRRKVLGTNTRNVEAYHLPGRGRRSSRRLLSGSSAPDAADLSSRWKVGHSA